MIESQDAILDADWVIGSYGTSPVSPQAASAVTSIVKPSSDPVLPILA